MSNQSQQEVLTEISSKLDLVLGFMAIRGIENDETAMVKRLGAMGLRPRIISHVSGLTENAVNIRLSRSRKKKSKK